MARINHPGEHHIAMLVFGLQSSVDALCEAKVNPRLSPLVVGEHEDLQAVHDKLGGLLNATRAAMITERSSRPDLMLQAAE